MGGERYVWIDVLCLDQRKRNESEISRMRLYYANARGCLVWLDKCNDARGWSKVLSAIVKINKFFNMDKSGISTRTVDDMMRDGLLDLKMSATEVFQWLEDMISVENAPWFRRVWTLQEGVIPDNLYFVTPERYMVSSACMFQICALCAMVANLLLETGSVAGIATVTALQKSEIWKLLRLRQLHRKKRITYWHIQQAIKTRSCKYEQDKVFGVCGIFHGRIPSVDYNRTLKELNQDLYRSSIDQNEFGTILFLNGSGLEPTADSLPFVASGVSDHPETHRLIWERQGLRLQDVGVNYITKVWPIVTYGKLVSWQKKFPEFMGVPFDVHFDIARAFEIPAEEHSQLCPASFAAIGALSFEQDDPIVRFFPAEFVEKYEQARPKGMLMWMKALFMMQACEHKAFVVLWTSVGDPQIAVVTERIEGSNILVVTPSSYVDKPGEGGLICQLTPDRTFRTIGIALGTKVKASTKISLVLS